MKNLRLKKIEEKKNTFQRKSIIGFIISFIAFFGIVSSNELVKAAGIIDITI